uniref:NEDD8-conjugating enzyme UBC12 n=1 Tax=Oncorhynchus tshawytscha TaxID=74940 RepID=A0AAZ3QGP1_ONCTS
LCSHIKLVEKNCCYSKQNIGNTAGQPLQFERPQSERENTTTGVGSPQHFRRDHWTVFIGLRCSDINELNLPKTCEIVFPDQDDLLNFKLIISPDEGFYKGGKFVFSFKVGQGYPHDPPKVKCETMVYHPNIDLEGNVCLNILREDWKPVLTVNSIIYGLQYLFLEPNPEDPLNKEAAEVLQTNRRLFEQNVQRSLRGGYVGATYFERCLK